jgi:predicted DNA-binding ribbon-helix-helix protein
MERELMIVTSIRINRKVWRMLRALAETRALEVGGRPSVSALVADLAEEKAAQQARGPRG